MQAGASKFCKPSHELLQDHLSPQIEIIWEILTISMACDVNTFLPVAITCGICILCPVPQFHVSFAHSPPFHAQSAAIYFSSTFPIYIECISSSLFPQSSLSLTHYCDRDWLGYTANQFPFSLGTQTIFPSFPYGEVEPSNCILANGMHLQLLSAPLDGP